MRATATATRQRHDTIMTTIATRQRHSCDISIVTTFCDTIVTRHFCESDTTHCDHFVSQKCRKNVVSLSCRKVWSQWKSLPCHRNVALVSPAFMIKSFWFFLENYWSNTNKIWHVYFMCAYNQSCQISDFLVLAKNDKNFCRKQAKIWNFC